VLRHDASGCAVRALAAFLAARPVGSCAKVSPLVPPARYRPARVTALRAVGAKGAAGRTLAAVYYTLDASWRDQASYSAWYGLKRSVRLPALRGGSVAISRSGIVLRRAVVVRGVRVSGRLARDGAGRVRVDGRVAGVVVVGRRTVRGTLGGVSVVERL
jgi:hypothetical protein